jgi:predicted nucleic acid-binding protein
VIGIDTGFFFALREGDRQAIQIFRESEIAISVLTLFELRRLALRKGIPWGDFGAPLEKIAMVAEISRDVADPAAIVSYNAGLPAIDAMIIASLQALGCEKIYTRDRHFTNYHSKEVEIILLS